jgi:hypothetical protein
MTILRGNPVWIQVNEPERPITGAVASASPVADPLLFLMLTSTSKSALTHCIRSYLARLAFNMPISNNASHAAITPPPPEAMTMPASFLMRPDAAEYLSDLIGRKMTGGALARHAYAGTGPRYQMVLGRATYRIEDLDAWAEGLAKAPSKYPSRGRKAA